MAALQEAASTPARLGGSEPGGWRHTGRGVLLPLGFAVLVAGAWEILCRTTRISPLLLPAPSAIWKVLSESYDILFQHALPTTIETVVSFGLATLLGVALAVAITFSAWVREALFPNIVMFQLIPKIALAPLFIVWLGVGSKSCIVVAIFIAFFPVVVSTATKRFHSIRHYGLLASAGCKANIARAKELIADPMPTAEPTSGAGIRI